MLSVAKRNEASQRFFTTLRFIQNDIGNFFLWSSLSPGIMNTVELRHQINQWLDQLSPEHLVLVANFVDF